VAQTQTNNYYEQKAIRGRLGYVAAILGIPQHILPDMASVLIPSQRTPLRRCNAAVLVPSPDTYAA
jgi:hypothetical protein